MRIFDIRDGHGNGAALSMPTDDSDVSVTMVKDPKGKFIEYHGDLEGLKKWAKQNKIEVTERK